MPPSPTKKGFKTNLSENSIVTLPIPKNIRGSNDQEDSTPLDFDTFVPSHNPLLDLPLPSHASSTPGPDYVSHSLPPVPIVDEDEAFTRALGAMYWGGYWTAVYHVNNHFNSLLCKPHRMFFSQCRKSIAHKRPRDDETAVQGGEDEDEVAEQASDVEGEEAETDLVSTQR
jgi:hypothetical protein